VIDLLPTTTFARGYLVSHPPRYLGTLPGPALLAAGVDPVFPKAAHGIAIMQEGRLAAHAKSLEDARRKALLLNGNVTICEAVALTKNDTPVWRTLERIEWQPADELAGVSVLAKDAATADALATALFVMGLDKAMDFCKNHREIAALLVPKPETGGPRTYEQPHVLTFNLPREDVNLNPGDDPPKIKSLNIPNETVIL